MGIWIRSTCLLFTLLIFLFASFPTLAQSGAQSALEEMATAEDVETVLRHLPLSVERAIAQIPAAERKEIDAQLLVRHKLKEEGVEFEKKGDGSWELTGPANLEDPNGASAPREKILVTIKTGLEDDNGALLLIEAHPASTNSTEAHRDLAERKSALVWMKYQDGEWRVTELGEVEKVSIEDVVINGLVRGESSQAANAASAVGALRTLNTAIITYVSTYENLGLPLSIAQMACPSPGDCGEASAQHAGLLDPSFAASPLVRHGYEFQYTRLSHDRYTITATPVAMAGDTARRSFFTDQSGVIRYTQENRAATAEDPALQ